MKQLFIFFIALGSALFGDITPFDQCWGRVNPEHRRYTRFLTDQLNAAYEMNHFENVTPSTEPRIPKSIHMIWLGSPLPKRFEVFVQSWKQHHPDWDFKLWTDADIGSFPMVTKDAIHTVKNWGQKSDILRLEILNHFGGLYVDTDFYCVKPHDILHHTCDFYTGMGSKMILTGNIAARPAHPIIITCLERISKNKRLGQSHSAGIVQTTGPGLFMHAVINHIRKDPKGCIVYPPTYFYPFPIQLKRVYWKRKNPRIFNGYITKDSFAVHAWAHSWVKKPGKATRVVKEPTPDAAEGK